MVEPPVGRHLNTVWYVTEGSCWLPFTNVRTNPSRLLHEIMVEPIAHDHVVDTVGDDHGGDRTRRFDQDRDLTVVRKLNAEDRLFDDRLEPRVEKLLNPDRQPCAADFVSRMNVLFDGENRQADTAQLVGCS